MDVRWLSWRNHHCYQYQRCHNRRSRFGYHRWLLFITLLLCLLITDTATFKQSGGCYFPERWEGTWFQSGVRQPITIKESRLSSKGRCLHSEGDKFIVVDDKKVCYRCVVIHEKHANVLQYKETFCQGREAVSSLCSLITGDALLYSMFRENALAVPCPFHGAFAFTYNRGHGECKSPVSNIDNCIEDSRLLLSYQACPDVYGSESAVEELECLATWKEGSSRYLVGKVHHNHASSNEDRFRCFVYEKASASSEAMDGVEYRIAQSGDATCNGLFSASEGSRTMTLKKAPSLNKCRFPQWISAHNYWHTLDYSSTYTFHHRNSTLHVVSTSGERQEMKIVCSMLKHSGDNWVMLLTHFTTGCQSGFACMTFYRRDADVIEVQTGAHTKRSEDACSSNYFNRTTLPYITLVTNSPEPRKCPYMGKFNVNNIIRNERPQRSLKIAHRPNLYYQDDDDDDNEEEDEEEQLRRLESMRFDVSARRIKRVNKREQPDVGDCDNPSFSQLIIGCNSVDTMEFRADCVSSDYISTYSCHGRWEENGTSYLITTPLSRASHSARTYCFIYKEARGTDVVMFSTSNDSCDRRVRPGITGELVFNVSSIGKCLEAISHSNKSSFSVSLILVLSSLLILHKLLTCRWCAITTPR
ncbi:uncharacterized protein aus [Atheta coriaria]|uniref:uncharacterized protein aus n=1 Tax=Dalotia coriaria TaxID=877792 RepID=UPI0031F3F76F